MSDARWDACHLCDYGRQLHVLERGNKTHVGRHCTILNVRLCFGKEYLHDAGNVLCVLPQLW